MKLAEALLLRADRKRVFEQLQTRAQSVARYQEGEKPAEDANELRVKAEEALVDLERLIRQINKTNSQTELPDGRSLTAALAERDVLRLRYQLLTELADAGSGAIKPGAYIRQMRSELKWISAVPVAELRAEANEAAKRHRELDAEIQQVNWATELIED